MIAELCQRKKYQWLTKTERTDLSTNAVGHGNKCKHCGMSSAEMSIQIELQITTHARQIHTFGLSDYVDEKFWPRLPRAHCGQGDVTRLTSSRARKYPRVKNDDFADHTKPSERTRNYASP